jgi:hypothetical protein
MPQLVHFILSVIFTSVISISVSRVGHAADCDAVLFGIYTTTLTKSDVESYSHFLNVLDQYNVHSYEEAKSTATDLGVTLPIKGIPVEFQGAYRSDSSGKGNWASQLRTRLENDTATRSQFFATSKEANTSVVDAWKECDHPGVQLAPRRYMMLGDGDHAQVGSETAELPAEGGRRAGRQAGPLHPRQLRHP